MMDVSHFRGSVGPVVWVKPAQSESNEDEKPKDSSSESRGQENKTVLRGNNMRREKNNNAVAQLQNTQKPSKTYEKIKPKL